MSINQDMALSIAEKFAQQEYKNANFQLLLGKAEARLEQGGFGHAYLGLNKRYWSVLFELESTDPEVAVMSPDHVIVLVDAETGHPLWFPV